MDYDPVLGCTLALQLIVCPWTVYLTSLILSLFVCREGKAMAPASLACVGISSRGSLHSARLTGLSLVTGGGGRYEVDSQHTCWWGGHRP